MSLISGGSSLLAPATPEATSRWRRAMLVAGVQCLDGAAGGPPLSAIPPRGPVPCGTPCCGVLAGVICALCRRPVGACETIDEAIVGAEISPLNALKAEALVEAMRARVGGERIDEHRSDGRVGETASDGEAHH